MSLHILGPGFSTFVRSVRLCCEEKKLTYSYGMTLHGKPFDWCGETHRAYHPFGQVPVLFHEGKHVFETYAICRYLDAVFPDRVLISTDLAAHTEIDQWCIALTTSVDECLIRNYLLLVAGPNRPKEVDPASLARSEMKVESTLAVLDKQLGEQAFICGNDYSVADALLTPMLDYLADVSRPAGWLECWPRLRSYLDRMRSRPSGRVLL